MWVRALAIGYSLPLLLWIWSQWQKKRVDDQMELRTYLRLVEEACFIKFEIEFDVNSS